MAQYLPWTSALVSLGALIFILLTYRRLHAEVRSAIGTFLAPLGSQFEAMRTALEGAKTDLAVRLEMVKGEIRQESGERLERGFREVQSGLETQLSRGRLEQATTLRQEIETLAGQTGVKLDAIRELVDSKLLAIGGQVQAQLERNIREGLEQFEQVEKHLRAAEEQLRSVSTIGASINDLNNLLKLPHLRGKFGEASLERLLADFLPAHMYALQAPAGEDAQGRVDAVIRFPGRDLPIDAKFPREQILPLFETNDASRLDEARAQFARVMKEQGRRIAGYIRPENGTTDMALMYLPSETLYMETVLNADLSETLNRLRVFPVSPNTLIVTLQAIAMVFKMYEFAKSHEKATQELAKAQRSFAHFEGHFEKIGNALDRAQESYRFASSHLNRYRNRVADLSGEAPSDVEPAGNDAETAEGG